jgi:UDP-glucose 4-epimerase
VDRLLAAGWKVVVVDNLSTGFRRNVDRRAKLYVRDLRKQKTAALIRKLKPEAIFHLAAQASVPQSIKDPVMDAETNIHATLHLLDAAASVRVKHFIFAATGGALSSEKGKLPTDEDHTPEPTSPYAIAKLTCERYGSFYRRVHGLPFVALRFGNVYGPRQNPYGEAGVVSIFATNMFTGRPVHINGTGKQTRDFIYVGDVVDALMAALKQPKAEGPYFVGTGMETSVNELFRRISKLAGYGKKALRGPADVAASFRSCLDSSKILMELGWKAQTSLEQGLRLTVDWFRERA